MSAEETGIREALQLARERRGMSYQQVADAAGLRRSNVHHALYQDAPRRSKGQVPMKEGMSVSTIERLCKALNCGVRYRPGDGWHATELEEER